VNVYIVIKELFKISIDKFLCNFYGYIGDGNVLYVSLNLDGREELWNRIFLKSSIVQVVVYLLVVMN